MDFRGEIIIYKSPEGDAELAVKLEKETVWLTQSQLVTLFKTTKQNVSLHINNVFSEGELDRNSVVKDYLTTAKDGKKYKTKHYNLDVIISIGYRVKSKRGTQFRIWANKVLKEYLIQGYSLNEKRLNEQTEKVKELEKSIEIFKRVSENYQLKQDELTGILNVISDYTYALDILDQYDNQRLKVAKSKTKEEYQISYKDAKEVIEGLRKTFSSSKIFGKEKDKSFQGSLKNIYQTFGKKQLYPSLEEKAAALLYFTVKNHAFVDGNKRIAAAVFLMYLARNNFLYRKDGSKRIADNALVALCLLIAESHPKEKEVMLKVIVNLINQKN